MPRGRRPGRRTPQAESYQHKEATSLNRPDVGTQAQFKKKKPPKTYRYDDSLSPALDWDGQNPAREVGESRLSVVQQELSVVRRHLSVEKPDLKAASASLRRAEEAAQSLKAMSKPFLNWAGKAERLSFDVPTLPLFVHERLSTKAIIETLTSHKRDTSYGQADMFSLFGDPQHSVTDQVLRAYEYQDKWVNRMILGDSLVVMNSLLEYESLGGKVQMIYMDPPYGVKFGSNFQPFVRKRDVSHNDDEDMTREPEMVQAYRDTWELGLHSYLTYLRDRLLIARDLLAPSGSIFVQISDENLHHVREAMDEVFGNENFVAVIPFRKTGSQDARYIGVINDFLLFYARDLERMKFRKIYLSKDGHEDQYTSLLLQDGTTRRLTPEERVNPSLLPPHAKIFQATSLQSDGRSEDMDYRFGFDGSTYEPNQKSHWKTSTEGLKRLAENRRIIRSGKGIRYIRFLSDFPFTELTNLWEDTYSAADMDYVVQTSTEVVQRCISMTTDPGDLVLDPTSGSGTTAYVAEQWGRRWITIDTSRVPLALARQRLLTATFPWYELNDEARGPAGGFRYLRKQNKKGEEVGGIVPHVTLESIANNEPPKEEVLVDRPEKDDHITRVTGAFCVEGTIPTPVGPDAGEGRSTGVPPVPDHGQDGRATYVDRMLEILRHSPVLRLSGNRTVTLKNLRPPAKTLALSAEALVNGNGRSDSAEAPGGAGRAAIPNSQIQDSKGKPVALVFGPENGAVSERLVQEAAREAWAKNYTHLYVVGFAIQPNARQLIENCEAVIGIPATYVQATPDLMMGELLKNMRSSQIFSVCGLPEIRVSKAKADSSAAPRNDTVVAPRNDTTLYQVELLGLDVFDPITMETHHAQGDDVPAWFLDTDYNGLCFHVSQAFFPRTSAWDNLKKALRGEYEESVWDHLAGTKSAPFEPGEHRQVAVKVIDDRGNELMVVEKLA